MMSPLLKWQLLACAALSGVLLLEWMADEADRSQLQAKLDKKVQAEYLAAPLPTLGTGKQATDSYAVIVERPLFIEGRKPLLADVADSAEVDENGQLDDWLLIGIYNKDKKDKRKVALFRKQKEAKTFLKLRESQTISGWQLIQIQDDRVMLQQDGQEKSIMLRKPRPQTKPETRKPFAPTKPATPNVPPVNNSSENDTNER